MPDDVGGRPFPDGGEPDDDRGGADETFASVVFDEDFVRSAEIHEPTAVERLLAAAQARAEAEASRARSGGGALDDDHYDDGYGPDGAYSRERAFGDFGDADDPDGAYEDEDGPYGRHGGSLRPYRGSARWHRPVAWLLAVLMGIGMVALAFSAVYRGAERDRQNRVPQPVTSGVDKPGVGPSASVDHSRPAVSAVPRTP
ncbi:SCO2584 family spore wall biosynthesis protein [Streptomyces sp. ALB3]|uniref:SCO2584 family spore wall biosynthesis protein n=1 Tax=Streptomyces sp. ALB3 TaxID=3374278 RepID=UPI0037987C3F